MSMVKIKILAKKDTTVAGTVMDNTSGFREGDVVVCDGRIPCKSCRNCRRGDVSSCVNVKVFGRDFTDDNGTVGIDESQVYALPSGTAPEKAVYAGLCAGAADALEKIARRSMYRLAIAGDGEFGNILAQMALRSDAGKIYYFTHDTRQAELLNKKGISAYSLPERSQDYAAFIGGACGRVNAAIEATGDNYLAKTLMDNIAGGGVLVLAGNTTSEEKGLDFADARDFFFRICSIETSKPAAGYFSEGLEAIIQGTVEI